jgi:hydroxypyruvate isomerase
VRRTIPVVKALGVREVFLTTGEMGHDGRVAHAVAPDPTTRAITAYRVSNLAEQHDLIYSLENLNTKVDHPGYPLPHVSDVLALIDSVGSPRIRVLLDLYHAQVEEGNLIELVRLCGERIGHIQVADVPGRHEPGTGEVNYAAVAAELRTRGLSGGGRAGSVSIRDTRTGNAAFPRNPSSRPVELF